MAQLKPKPKPKPGDGAGTAKGGNIVDGFGTATGEDKPGDGSPGGKTKPVNEITDQGVANPEHPNFDTGIQPKPYDTTAVKPQYGGGYTKPPPRPPKPKPPTNEESQFDIIRKPGSFTFKPGSKPKFKPPTITVKPKPKPKIKQKAIMHGTQVNKKYLPHR